MDMQFCIFAIFAFAVQYHAVKKVKGSIKKMYAQPVSKYGYAFLDIVFFYFVFVALLYFHICCALKSERGN